MKNMLPDSRPISDFLHIKASGDGTRERPIFGRVSYDPDKDAHPYDSKCTSEGCGAVLGTPWRNMDQVSESDPKRWLFSGWAPIGMCDACYAKAQVTQPSGDWLKRCPIEFRKPWDAGKGDEDARVKAMRFEAGQGKGIVLHGASGSGKTRTAWQVVRKVAESGRTWLFLESLDFLDTLPPEAYRVDVLFLDDLGNEVLGPANEVRLLKLIRNRCDWHKPMVITTQHQGDSLAKRFREGASAQAVIRRLREFCEGIYVKARP